MQLGVLKDESWVILVSLFAIVFEDIFFERIYNLQFAYTFPSPLSKLLFSSQKSKS